MVSGGTQRFGMKWRKSSRDKRIDTVVVLVARCRLDFIVICDLAWRCDL